MDERARDVEAHIEALRAASEGRDPTRMAEAARKAQIALEFRASDAMIGLAPVESSRIEVLSLLANEIMERAAELGDLDAAVTVAEAIYWRQDAARAATALRYAEAAAAKPRAQTLLGWFSYVGFGRAIDLEASRAHHLRAAEAGEADSMFEMFVYSAKGIGQRADDSEALAWCERAARAGNARAMANLGGFYATGTGVLRDSEAAVRWYTEAADLGHGRAAATLGVMYAVGDGVLPAPDTARRWFRVAQDLGFDPLEMMIAADVDPDVYEQG